MTKACIKTKVKRPQRTTLRTSLSADGAPPVRKSEQGDKPVTGRYTVNDPELPTPSLSFEKDGHSTI